MHGSFSPGDWTVNSNGIAVVLVLVAIGLWRQRQIKVQVTWWIVCIATGLLLCSPIHTDAMLSYGAHMAEHVLIIAALVPFGLRALKLRGLSPTTSLAGFLAYVFLVPVYHLTSLGGVIMNSIGAHELELLLFALVGVAFWAGPCGDQFTKSQRLCYVALALPISIFTGVTLSSASTPPFTLDATLSMSDQLRQLHVGGSIMAILSSALLVIHLAVIAARSQRRLNP